MFPASDIRRVCVIGAGTIGASWAALFVSRGLEVTVSDPSPSAKAATQRFIDTAWPILTQLGALPTADPTAWRFVTDPAEAAAGADFVQENAPERYEIKQLLLAQLDAVLAPHGVIASSTSGLLLSRMTELCARPERCVIGHPFNPPHLIPLVEVLGNGAAGRAAVDTAMAFYAALGKRPIEIRKEVKGHVANRLQAALWREAIHLVAEGVASVEDIDAAVSEGPGLRWALMGQHMTFHLGGGQGGLAHFLEHLLPAVEGWWADLGAPQMTPELQAQLVRGVIEEAAGRSIADLAARRDHLLTQIIALKREQAESEAQKEMAGRLDEALEESFPASDPPAVHKET
ncbi:3-hydroxyacyl-CoA dehydrogenase NAD-binding domain-containing protein [Xanthobacter pseudotagetidis]|uniref:3-hydroxyacyl-CoA dehydrogenase NAD-binding domain-containing protein n=1 Tax=Xanthobacter pseudotagetidis TaxID=3119911 RepID=UPI003729162E